MVSKLFHSAQHLRLARSKRSAKACAEERSILRIVKSVKFKHTITSTLEIDFSTPRKQEGSKKKATHDAERLLPLTTALKASPELAIESKKEVRER